MLLKKAFLIFLKTETPQKFLYFRKQLYELEKEKKSHSYKVIRNFRETDFPAPTLRNLLCNVM